MTSIGNSAFFGCSKLTSIHIPEGVTRIGNSAFEGCSGLTSITIPEGVTSIGYAVFYDCWRLTSITIPEGVTSIGSNAFSNCSGLTSITIPKSVTSIGSNAFYGCRQLADVYCYAVAVPEAGYGIIPIFDDCTNEIGTLHVPAEALEAYKATFPWSQFHSIVPLTDVEVAVESVEDAPVGIRETYHLDGHRQTRLQRGMNILRMSDGTTRKVVVK